MRSKSNRTFGNGTNAISLAGLQPLPACHVLTQVLLTVLVDDSVDVRVEAYWGEEASFARGSAGRFYPSHDVTVTYQDTKKDSLFPLCMQSCSLKDILWWVVKANFKLLKQRCFNHFPGETNLQPTAVEVAGRKCSQYSADIFHCLLSSQHLWESGLLFNCLHVDLGGYIWNKACERGNTKEREEMFNFPNKDIMCCGVREAVAPPAPQTLVFPFPRLFLGLYAPLFASYLTLQDII